MQSNSSSPLVSVIIPTYNREDLLKEALESVLSQIYQNLEIIVVDNFSNFDFYSFIESFGDKRIFPFQNRNHGIIAVSRNFGIKKSRGEFIAFLDSDDIWMPQKIKKQLDFLINNPEFNWVFCGYEKFDHESGTVTSRVLGNKSWLGNINRLLLKENFISSPTPLIKRALIEKIGSFNEQRIFRAVEDWELWLRIAASHPIGFVNEILARYRVHPNSVSKQKPDFSRYEKYTAVLGSVVTQFPEIYSPFIQETVNHYCTICSKELFLNKNGKSARMLLAREIVQTSKIKSALLWLTMLFNRNIVISTKRFFRSVLG